VVHVAVAIGAWRSENGCGWSLPVAMATARTAERAPSEGGASEGTE
jgi:hypothetical protein